jgi:hypothetical protein
MYRIYFGAVILLALYACISSCRQISSALRTSSVKYGTILPTDWPMAQFSFPTSTSIICAPSHSMPFSPAGASGEMWLLYVNCPGGMKELAAHIESCIAPLGFARSVFLHNGASAEDDNFMRTYYSSDGKIQLAIIVDVTNGVMPKKLMKQKVSNAQLPASPPTITGQETIFQIMVNRASVPSSNYTGLQQLAVAGKARLEPLQ